MLLDHSVHVPICCHINIYLKFLQCCALTMSLVILLTGVLTLRVKLIKWFLSNLASNIF